MDKGPWTVGPEGDRIDSDDFTHDASLILYGDFRTSERRAYLQFIADELNSCPALRAAKEAAEGEIGRLVYIKGLRDDEIYSLSSQLQTLREVLVFVRLGVGGMALKLIDSALSSSNELCRAALKAVDK